MSGNEAEWFKCILLLRYSIYTLKLRVISQNWEKLDFEYGNEGIFNIALNILHLIDAYTYTK